MKLITDHIILVTGSTDGIGKLTALQLAKHNATVLVHGRPVFINPIAVAGIEKSNAFTDRKCKFRRTKPA